MTKEEKRERRKVKHALQKQVEKNHFSTDVKLRSTTNQLRTWSRKIADQLLAGRAPNTAVPLS